MRQFRLGKQYKRGGILLSVLACIVVVSVILAGVATLAVSLFRRAVPRSDVAQARLLQWAALLHETGMSVSHIGYHKHGAYILQNADMPGFSAGEQQRLALLVFGCRGGPFGCCFRGRFLLGGGRRSKPVRRLLGL